MSRKPHIWRIRLAFEPNRFSRDQLERVYEQLKPTETRLPQNCRHPSHL